MREAGRNVESLEEVERVWKKWREFGRNGELGRETQIELDTWLCSVRIEQNVAIGVWGLAEEIWYSFHYHGHKTAFLL